MATHTSKEQGRGVLRGEMPASPDAGLNNNHNASATDIAESFAARPVEELEFLASQAEIEIEARSAEGIGAREYQAARRAARTHAAEARGMASVSHQRLLGALDEIIGEHADVRDVCLEVQSVRQDYVDVKTHLVVRRSPLGRKASVKLTTTVWVDGAAPAAAHRVIVFRPWQKTVTINGHNTEDALRKLAIWRALESSQD